MAEVKYVNKLSSYSFREFLDNTDLTLKIQLLNVDHESKNLVLKSGDYLTMKTATPRCR